MRGDLACRPAAFGSHRTFYWGYFLVRGQQHHHGEVGARLVDRRHHDQLGYLAGATAFSTAK